jgi:hypothetical protein
MTLTDRKLNLICVGAIVAAVVAWMLGNDPLVGALFGLGVLYGFHNLQDALDARVSEVQPETIFDAVDAAVAAHNADLNASMELFVQPLTSHAVGVAAAQEAELQDVDEWGRPQPIRVTPPAARYFPIRMAQTSIAMNYVTAQKMTVQELQERLQIMFTGDANWMRRRLFAALFEDTAYNFADPQFGTVSIAPIANGDSETFGRSNGGAAATDDHIKGAASLTNTVIQDCYDELIEHPENGGDQAQVVAFVPTASRATVQALDGFVAAPDPNLTLGTGVNQYVGSFAGTAPGVPLGYHEDAKVHIREWPRLPSGYLIATTDLALKPIGMREDEEASLRGFGEIPGGREDLPYLQRVWSRRAGFGAYNRVGAVVYKTDNATYSVPTGYSNP